MKKIVLLLVVATLAGCVSDAPDGRTALEAIEEADKIAAGVLEEPMFLYAVAAEGPQAVEIYEQWIGPDTATAPFDFELDVTGDIMKDGRAMSWIVLYESQVNEGLAMVHVGETKGSKLLEHMDDGHTHVTGLGLQPEGNFCETSPEFQTDSNQFAQMLNDNSDYLEFQNQTPADTRFYYLFAEGSCFNSEVVHWMGLLANETEALAVLADGENTLEVILSSPAPVVLIDRQDTFTAEVDQPLASPEHRVSFTVPEDGTANVFAAWESSTSVLPGETVHVYLDSPSGERQDFATFTSAVAGKQAYIDLTAGQWTMVYHSTTVEPLSSYTVKTIVAI